MLSISVESGVEMPDFKRRVGRLPKYPFEKMWVGDSFLVPSGKENSVRSQVRRRNRKGPEEYRVRMTDIGLRVWRVR